MMYRKEMVFLFVLLILGLQEGTSNYFKGLMLIICYLIVAASFFVHIDPTSIGELLSTREKTKA